MDDPLPGLGGVQVDHADDRVVAAEDPTADHGPRRDVVGVGQQVLAVDVEEPQRVDPLHRRVLATDPVERGQQRHQRIRTVPVPFDQLVLLAVEVLLVVLRRRRVLAQLEARVHTPARRQGGGEHRPQSERGQRPVAQRSREDVGRVGPEVRAEPPRGRPTDQLLAVAAQVPGRGPPREVRVALVEAHLGEGVHHRRQGERLGQQHQVGPTLQQLGDDPRPERQRLGVRVVDPEDPHPPLGPRLEHAAARLPQRDAVLVAIGPEVDRVDVLVLLRRVLGVADGAVGQAGEPLGVLGGPRVIGAALEGDVERHFDTELGGPGDEAVEVRQRPQLGVQRVVAARSDRQTAVGRRRARPGEADRPRAADVAGTGHQRVVRTLAVGHPDRVDRRQVQHVEPRGGHRLEPVPRARSGDEAAL